MVSEALGLDRDQAPVDRGTVAGADEAVDRLTRPVEAPPNPLDLAHRRSLNQMIRFLPLFRSFGRPFRESVHVRADDEPDGVCQVLRRPAACLRRPGGR